VLIPEAFRGASPEALLAIDPKSGAALGCATFQRSGESLVHLRVRVLRNWRRRGIGRTLVRNVAAAARHAQVHARVDPRAEPDGEPFLRACGFVLKSRILTVEAEREPLGSCISRLARGLIASGKVAAGVRVARPADTPRQALARLYTELVVPELNVAPCAAVPLVSDPRFAYSPVLLMDGNPVGMLLIEANDGNNVCVVVARAVAPEFRGGTGWANLLMLAEGFERGGKQGSVRMRFEAPEDNPDTMKLVARARGEIIGQVVWFVRNTGDWQGG
jgi:ribosomal protein S18 acetylase RimI-like enzyme